MSNFSIIINCLKSWIWLPFGAQDDILWCQVLRLRQPKFVYFFKWDSLLLPTRILLFGKGTVHSWCLMLWISNIQSKDSLPLSFWGGSTCTSFQNQLLPYRIYVWLLIFQDMHQCAPLRTGKHFLRKRSHYIYKKVYMPTVTWNYTAKNPQDDVSMIDS